MLPLSKNRRFIFCLDMNEYRCIFFTTQYNADALKHVCTNTPMNARTPYPYEHLRETEPAYLAVDEVTTESKASVKILK
jgi:hypothetical protein